jgi:hypothetical protein
MRTRKTLLLTLVFGLAITTTDCKHEPFAPIGSTSEICFERDVQPILISNCAYSGCHSASSRQEGVDLSSYESAIKTGDVVAGEPKKSEIYEVLSAFGEKRMPPSEKLSAADDQMIYDWISQGAKNIDCLADCDTNAFTFSGTVQPLVDSYCKTCHSGSNPNGNLLLTNYDEIKVIANSDQFSGVLRANGYPLMPQGNPLSECQIRQVEKWIESGAPNN